MKKDIFSEKVSAWSNTTRTSANNITTTIGDFLQWGTCYLNTPHMPADIARLRALYDEALMVYARDPARAASLFDTYKRLKRCMPLATMGGVFAAGGLREDMLRATNVLTIDIDATKPTDYSKYEGKEIPNARVADWQELKWQLARLPFVAYAGLSIGGHGLFLLIPIDDSTKYTERWQVLAHLLHAHLHLTVDPQTKDITRPRFVSYDPHPHVNHQAEVFTACLKEHKAAPRRTAPTTATEQAVSICVEEVEQRKLDITSNYDDWINLAAALHNGLGEAGKQYFERLSLFYPTANEKEISRKWRQNRNRRIDIGFFFNLCSQFGVRWQTTTPQPPPLAAPPARRDQDKPDTIRTATAATAGSTSSSEQAAGSTRTPSGHRQPPPTACHIIRLPLCIPEPHSYTAVYDEPELSPEFFTIRSIGGIPPF